MRNLLRLPVILTALLALLVAAPATAGPEEEAPKGKTGAPQTQTAPATAQEKGKAPATPRKPGVRAIQGMVMAVSLRLNAIFIRTVTSQYQVHVTPETVLLRNGKPVKIEDIRPRDRVDACYFTAKSVGEKIIITSPEKAIAPPPPLPEP